MVVAFARPRRLSRPSNFDCHQSEADTRISAAPVKKNYSLKVDSLRFCFAISSQSKQPIVQIRYVSFPWAMDQGFTLPLSNPAAATVSVKPDRVYRFRVQCSVQEAS